MQTQSITLAPVFRYAVKQNVDGAETQVGVVMAHNYYAANRKALTLFSRHCWVERLS